MPEPVIDVVEPFFKVIVELGYDRSIKPGEPTPARLIPPLNPATVAADLVDAVGEGVNNALALTGSAPLLKIPAVGSSADTNGGSVFGSPDKLLDLNAFGDGIANSLSALDPFSTDQGNKQAGTDAQNSGPQTGPGPLEETHPQVADRRLQVHTPQAEVLHRGQPDRRASGDGRRQRQRLAQAGR